MGGIWKTNLWRQFSFPHSPVYYQILLAVSHLLQIVLNAISDCFEMPEIQLYTVGGFEKSKHSISH